MAPVEKVNSHLNCIKHPMNNLTVDQRWLEISLKTGGYSMEAIYIDYDSGDKRRHSKQEPGRREAVSAAGESGLKNKRYIHLLLHVFKLSLDRAITR